MLLQLLCDNKEVIRGGERFEKHGGVFQIFAAFFDLSANFPEDISLAFIPICLLSYEL